MNADSGDTSALFFYPRTTFQSSPGFGAGRYCISSSFFMTIPVSILARLWGRALRQCRCPNGPNIWFQSSPGFGAGRYIAGAENKVTGETVSILARLWGRALQHFHVASFKCLRFQSSPGFGAGRYLCVISVCVGMICFNPRPALGPGATQRTLSA